MSRSKGPSLTCRDCGYLDEAAQAGAKCPTCTTVLVPARVLKKYAKDEVLGRVVGGKYAVVSILGVGGFGAVYRAVQEPVGRHVALKVVHAQHVEDAEMRARFFREAKVVARLNDPAVVTLFDYGEEASIGLYMVFELVSGRNLGQVIKEGPQDSVWTAHILLQTLRALSEAHGLGMVHRDIKPANIMVVENQGQQSVRVLDFGIAKVAQVENQEASLQTREGMVLGTPQYMSPEQAKASAHLDARSDLYSLAVVAYSLIAGKNPFERDSMVETIMAHVGDTVPAFAPHLHVPPALEAALRRALEKDPDLRFQSAAEMSEAVNQALPNVAFPSLTYEYRAPETRGAGSLMGAALEGPMTPTPSAAMLSAGSGGAAYPAPRPFTDPGAQREQSSPLPAPEVSMGSATAAQSVGVSGAHSDPTSRRLIVGIALLLLSVLAMGGTYVWSQKQIDSVPLAEPIVTKAAPLPTEPVPRAVALVARGDQEEAASSLARAIAAVQGPQRLAMLSKAKSEDSLKGILKRPLLKALMQAPAPAKAEPAKSRPRAPTPKAAPPPARPRPRTAPRPSAPQPKPTPKKGLDVPEF